MPYHVSSTTATLNCTLPCFSPDIQCSLFNITPNNGEVITHHQIMESTMNYSYPTQQIIISNLTSGRSYSYCVGAINTNNNITVRDPVCGSFHTISGIAMVSLF